MDCYTLLNELSRYEPEHTFEPLGRGFIELIRPAGGFEHEKERAAELAEAKIESRKERADSVVDKSKINPSPSPEDLLSENFYEVLGLEEISFDATDAQIRYAHRRLLMKHHPDKNDSPNAGTVF